MGSLMRTSKTFWPWSLGEQLIEMNGPPSWPVGAWAGLTHLCLALAVQYLRFLSGSFTWPSRQHWPHTNFIFKLRGRPRPAAAPSPTTPPPGTVLTPPPPMHSPPTPPITPGCMLPLWWGTWMGWNTQQRNERSTWVGAAERETELSLRFRAT